MFDPSNTPGTPAGPAGMNEQRKPSVPYPTRTRMQLTKPAQAMNLGAASRRQPQQVQNTQLDNIFAPAGDLGPSAMPQPQAGTPNLAAIAESLGMTPDELQMALAEIFARNEAPSPAMPAEGLDALNGLV